MPETIRTEGLRELQRALKKTSTDLPKELRVGLNEVAGLIVDYAKPRFPRRSGRAAGSLKAASTQKQVRISLGGSRAPYAPWLDFGGSVGPRRSVHRPFYREGRYVYQGLKVRRPEILEAMEKVIVRTAKSAGLEVTTDG